ncbi:ion channel [uncultured Draconibacterium sp.]|uniref:ion channel n=1 Tax=uncultured Draconibacterium sp. TaxID=1573823 RepID=UPI0032618092
MSKSNHNNFYDLVHLRRFEILLFSFFILLFGDLFIVTKVDLFPFLVAQNVVASLLIFHNRLRKKLFFLLVIILLVALELCSSVVIIPNTKLAFFLTYIVYFAFLSVNVYRQVLFSKEVSIGMIAAVLCGFIILGLTGGFIFSMIEYLQPHSFNNIAVGVAYVSDLIYFSFITILSIGYGDITPATQIAQKTALLFGLLGYFYGVVVIGVIIGKYLARK